MSGNSHATYTTFFVGKVGDCRKLPSIHASYPPAYVVNRFEFCYLVPVSLARRTIFVSLARRAILLETHFTF